MLDDYGLEDLDLDLDNVPDSIDPFIDVNGNAISDDLELGLDLDQDGMPDWLAPQFMDLDSDLMPDGFERGGPDLDWDGIGDGIDPFLDADGDQIPDAGFYGYLKRLKLASPFGGQ